MLMAQFLDAIMLGQKGMRRRWLRLATVSFILTFSLMLYMCNLRPLIVSHSSFSSIITPKPSLVCPKISASDNITVILRTGATESQEKLPVHFDTVLSCVPDFIIYSDFNETIQGFQTHDILFGVNETIKDTATEFALYRHLRAHRREGLSYETMYGSGPSGADNPGWKLDKWKFLPMVDRALQDRRNATWFVFVEGDTYLLWQNMVAYLAKFDANKPYYLGKHMYINSILFGHGGSGFVLSRPAAEMVSRHWRQHLEEYDDFTRTEWAGDAILGKALKDAGVDMFWSFPHLQGDSLTTIDWNVSKLEREPWCYAPMTFHHMNEAEFRQLWDFERQWLAKWGATGAPSPRFRDIFKNLVLPKLRHEIKDWDNLSSGKEYSEAALAKWSVEEENASNRTEREAHFSFQHCRDACESHPSCLQYSFNDNGVCFISNELKLGHAVSSRCIEYSNAAGKCIKSSQVESDVTATGKAGITSGWIMSRVEKYVSDLDQSCQNKGEKDWVI